MASNNLVPSHRCNKVDLALLNWYNDNQIQGKVLPDAMLQQKAREINKTLNGDVRFAASNAWLNRWKKQYVLSQLNLNKKLNDQLKLPFKKFDVDRILGLFEDDEDEIVATTYKILLVEPFYGGSHKQLIDTLLNEFGKECELITLPAKKWPWRARFSALTISQLIPRRSTYKTLFCSSVLNLSELIGLRPDLQKLKKIVYFHENQLVYPKQKIKERDYQFGYNQITTCLVADHVIFNSLFNLNSFLWNVECFISIMPDCRPTDILKNFSLKAQVLYFPIQFSKIPEIVTKRNDDILHIIWPHRWEFDKGPQEFFNVLFKLKNNQLKFKVSVLGETFTTVPDIFMEAKQKLQSEIVNWGFIESKNQYYEILHSAHIVVSTAQHEFYGVSTLEAVYCGCYPLVPDRLVYPEIYEKKCLYKNDNDLYNRLKEYCNSPQAVQKDYKLLKIDLSKYSSEKLIPEYKNLFTTCS